MSTIGDSQEVNLSSEDETDGISMEETSECEDKPLRTFVRVMDPDLMVVEEKYISPTTSGDLDLHARGFQVASMR